MTTEMARPGPPAVCHPDDLWNRFLNLPETLWKRHKLSHFLRISADGRDSPFQQVPRNVLEIRQVRHTLVQGNEHRKPASGWELGRQTIHLPEVAALIS